MREGNNWKEGTLRVDALPCLVDDCPRFAFDLLFSSNLSQHLDLGFRDPGKAQVAAALEHYKNGVPQDIRDSR